ncbi:MAG: Holliday junction DNA helicase RuvA [Ignavibacteria bacterium RIFOXYB2_FULL_35_12]|nr:MAG: Holliday junction DNA helicase RuvA [Ignavibacteria bacterium GWA2_36_19]OGU60775.1 MAG: Holliday junction DNA helicase RuvA [Ignavibacteria bacterium GWF2_35_20]OGU83083.1 MAG: Holliday junction DNA helicase RuvA [Ignavibacteria bacterium RIFOXYA2_FULL_35_9]OGU84186.1 MAG: Holliday junction DNA helicase RuvA [Ignavibacteria bacterium RIFOXYA12_FULL_35_25]OGU90054.1 MAG: Holliday junction DNA helicase RuvA [Ignavibacteria bacterium RIFOXYC12_FULL_35_11]OGU97336.1 MAG: Holliday junction
MIGFLTGKIISSKPTKVMLDVNGVGYIVGISINTFEKISGKEIASLFIHTSVKEDSISLFGFHSEAEKEMFELLISVSGIGPKIALSLLSGIQTDDLKNAIQSSDISRIIAVPGIGRKTAERLVLELKTKVDQIKEEGVLAIPLSVKSEAVSALSTLGYNSKFADNVVRNILQTQPTLSLEELIKKALGELNR